MIFWPRYYYTKNELEKFFYMKRVEEEKNKKRINSEVITLQKMSPNVLAIHYLREANNQVLAGKYEESAMLYQEAVNYFNKALSKGIVISKSNYTNAICNLATVLYNIGCYHIKKGNLVIALYYFSISNALGQSVDALYNMGYVENLQKYFKEAHDYYNQAFQLASKFRQNTLVICKAIKNNIIEYFIDLCQTSDFMDKFESLAGRKTTYK